MSFELVFIALCDGFIRSIRQHTTRRYLGFTLRHRSVACQLHAFREVGTRIDRCLAGKHSGHPLHELGVVLIVLNGCQPRRSDQIREHKIVEGPISIKDEVLQYAQIDWLTANT
jgi:hypothetical protein